MSPDDYDDFDDVYDDEDELDREADCGLMDDGQCMLAGTEWCDFECPNRDSELFAGSEAWRKKHERKARPSPTKDGSAKPHGATGFTRREWKG